MIYWVCLTGSNQCLHQKNSIKLYSLHLSSESVVCFCFLSGHLSAVLAPGLQTEGTRMAPSSREKHNQILPNPPSQSPVHLSFMTLLEEGKILPSLCSKLGLGPDSPSPLLLNQHRYPLRGPLGATPIDSFFCQGLQPDIQTALL